MKKNNSYMFGPVEYLSIVVGYATIIQVLYQLFSKEMSLLEFLVPSIILIWISVIFKGLELIDFFRKTSKSISEITLVFAILIQGGYLFQQIWNRLSTLNLTIQIFLIVSIILYVAKDSYYFRRIKKYTENFIEVAYKNKKLRKHSILYLFLIWFFIYEFVYDLYYQDFNFWFILSSICIIVLVIFPLFSYFYQKHKS